MLPGFFDQAVSEQAGKQWDEDMDWVKRNEQANPLGWPWEEQKNSMLNLTPYERSLVFLVRGFMGYRDGVEGPR